MYMVECPLIVEPLCNFIFQPMHHKWSNKGHGMYCLVWTSAYERFLTTNRKDVYIIITIYNAAFWGIMIESEVHIDKIGYAGEH